MLQGSGIQIPHCVIEYLEQHGMHPVTDALVKSMSGVTQGTDKWREFRSRTIGASTAPMIMGTSRFGDSADFLRKQFGFEEPTISTRRGIEMEAIVVESYKKVRCDYLNLICHF